MDVARFAKDASWPYQHSGAPNRTSAKALSTTDAQLKVKALEEALPNIGALRWLSCATKVKVATQKLRNAMTLAKIKESQSRELLGTRASCVSQFDLSKAPRKVMQMEEDRGNDSPWNIVEVLTYIGVMMHSCEL